MGPKYSRYYTFVKPILRNRHIRTYSPLVFSLITIAIFSIFAIKPTVSTILSLQKSIVEQHQVLDKLRQKANNLSQGKNNYSAINPSTLSKMDNLLPAKASPASLINSLTNLAGQAEASLSGIQFQPINLDTTPYTLTKNPALKELTITFNLQSTYPKMVKFIKSLDSLDRLITIDSISFNESADNSLVTTINARAFYIR